MSPRFSTHSTSGKRGQAKTPGQDGRPRIHGQEQSRETGVGYGRPPRRSQWRPGQSGNARGRPRGAKNESTILRDILSKKIKQPAADRIRTVTVLEAILMRIADDSLKGNVKSAALLLNRFGALVSDGLKQPELTEDDREILEAFTRRIRDQQPETLRAARRLR
jgi:uncharacterized protein DUF5681